MTGELLHLPSAFATGQPGLRRATGLAASVPADPRFEKLVRHSTDITLVLDDQVRVVWISPAVTAVLGHAPGDLLGRNALHLVHPDDVDTAVSHMVGLFEGRTYTQSLAVRVAHADGTWRHVGIVASDLTADPDVGGMLLNVRDITGRVTAQQASDRLSRIVEATPDLIGIWERGAAPYLNRSAHEFFGLRADAPVDVGRLAGFAPRWVVKAWRDEVRPALLREGMWSGELAARNRSGRATPLSVVVLATVDGDGQVQSVSGIARDMSERAQYEARLAHQATHDPLTGLPNRTLLIDRLGQAVRRAGRSERLVGVLFIDLDRFKIVNDSLGHDSGDRLLAIVAERLASTLRPGDTVARFGGDEFVILCESLRRGDEAVAIAERVATAVAAPVDLGDTEVFVSVSIGIAIGTGVETPPDELLRDADSAMYEAKDRGRSRTEMFDRRLRDRAVDRLELEGALRRAVERRELVVVYQPLFHLASGHPIGFEALVRWQHPERGLLLPEDFLAIAEDSRLIIPMGIAIAREACRVLAVARAARAACAGDGGELSVAVNLSARQLANPDLADEFAAIFRETGIDPGHVHLEITESVLMEDVDGSQRQLERLKALGVLIAVDDFGTGYSSFAYLRRFPVDLLKVDRSFVDGLGTASGDSEIVAAVVSLAHTLGLVAIAEGVETFGQLDELRRLGCDHAQGYLLGRPMGEADLLVALQRSIPSLAR